MIVTDWFYEHKDDRWYFRVEKGSLSGWYYVPKNDLGW